MQLTNKTIGIILVLAIAGSAIIALPFLTNLINPTTTNPTTTPTTMNENLINFTLLDTAGVLIEALGMHIYLDPYNLTEDYTYPPADAILVTHGHRDHYDSSVIKMLQKEDTVTAIPVIYTSYISEHDGISVKPRDQIQIGSINITAFYMYESAREGFTSNHLRQNNYTSYIVEINGFVFFHAGDANNIEEYAMLTGQIDVALLPLYWHDFYHIGSEVVNMTQAIQPRYLIPIHFAEEANESFVLEYSTVITETTDTEIICLDYYQSITFEIEN